MASALGDELMARPTVAHSGDIDLAAVGALIADPGRCRVLLALGDGRALPASRLADEAGVTPSTASSHLARLVDGGLLRVERHGRHRFFRLSRPDVGRLIEALAQLAPAQPVRSLRQGSRAQALRSARSCYDHLAGQLGVEIMAAMIGAGHVAGGDGAFDPATAERDRLNGHGSDIGYYLWVRRSANTRAVTVTPGGRHGLAEHFGVTWPAIATPDRSGVRLD